MVGNEHGEGRMIRQVRITLRCKSDGFAPPRNIAYNLYGMLNEKIESGMADAFHRPVMTPMGAYTVWDRAAGRLDWYVSAFGEEGRAILGELERTQEFSLHKLRVELAREGFETLFEATEEEFIRRYLMEEAPKKEIGLRFVTPCAFKSDGEYVNMPTKALLVKSCAQKWDAFSTQFKITDEEAISDLVSHSRIAGYRLASATYMLKNVPIPAFMGEVTVRVGGPEPLQRLMNLLLAFAPYAGVGIKAALGMGGVQIFEVR
jgi:CRISPR-associated endoribonuclease Cas6